MKLIDQIKQKPEYILIPILVIVIFIVSWRAFNSNKDIKHNEFIEERQNTVSDSLKHVLDSITLTYKDSIAILDYQIGELQIEIENKQALGTNISDSIVQRLDELVQISKNVIGDYEKNLELLQTEPIRNKYTPSFFGDLLNALIENLKSKQLTINELETEVNELSLKLEQSERMKKEVLAKNLTLKSNLSEVNNRLNKTKIELNNVQSINYELLKVEFAIGKKRELLKAGVLVKPFLKKQIYIGLIDAIHLNNIQLEKNKISYILSNSVSEIEEFNIVPTLKGAKVLKDGNSLVLKVNNVLEFVEMKQFVVYY